MPPTPEPLIYLSAGEASGDVHGATLCHALRQRRPDLALRGMGGVRMAAAGMDVVADVSRHAVVGSSEAVGRLPTIYRAYRLLRERLASERPRALVLIDFPEFNLWLARAARRAGIPIVYFIPPQLWAWRRGRIRQVARRISRVLTVLPFEADLYREAGIKVDFVGHPLLDVLPLDLTRDEARRQLGLDPSETVVGLLPGSRREEVSRLLPPMLIAARRLHAAGATRRFAVGVAPTVDAGTIAPMIRSASAEGGPRIDVFEGRTHHVMVGSDALILSSGTATLEAALLGVPMVVCYRVSRLTEAMVRMLIRVQWCSLPNLIAGRLVVPELLQDDVSGQRLASEALRLLEDPMAATAQRAAFKEVRAMVGEPGVGDRAARRVLEAAGLLEPSPDA